MTLSHANEKFTQAVHALATGRGRINERLSDAFGHHLAHIRPHHHLPPGDLRDEFMRLLDIITTRDFEPHEGAFLASVRSLSEDEAVMIADRIVQLAVLVEVVYEEGLEP